MSNKSGSEMLNFGLKPDFENKSRLRASNFKCSVENSDFASLQQNKQTNKICKTLVFFGFFFKSWGTGNYSYLSWLLKIFRVLKGPKTSPQRNPLKNCLNSILKYGFCKKSRSHFAKMKPWPVEHFWLTFLQISADMNKTQKNWVQDRSIKCS